MAPIQKAIKVTTITLVLTLILACSQVGLFPVTHRHKTKFLAEDTLSFYSIDIYARIPDTYKGENLFVILDIILPEEGRYSDTLTLPVRMDRIPYLGVDNGRWRDMKWNYRNNIKFTRPGVWRFYIRRDTSKPDSCATGAIGLLIKKM